jgi:hypothetical protein
MSENILKLIPTTIQFVPAQIKQDSAYSYLEALFPDSDIEFTNSEEVVFVDQGSNFESVSCNLCHQEMDMEFWGETMGEASENQFTDLIFTTECCNGETSLNDLVYDSPAGFAHFVMAITSPGEPIEDENLKELETILGTELKQILARY